MTTSSGALDDELGAALGSIARRRPLLVVSDFDGTLSDIVADPDAAGLHPDALEVLLRLADQPAVSVAVMSGRGLADLRERVGATDRLRLIGSHGAEYDGVATGAGGDRDALVVELLEVMSGFVGAHLEVKPVSASVHTRRMADRKAAEMLRDMTLAGPATSAGRSVKVGKEVVEIAVCEADKGVALARLAEEVGAVAVLYLGDDVTDEDAFAVLGADDVGIKVGDGSSTARFRVADPAGAVAALTRLAAALERTAG